MRSAARFTGMTVVGRIGFVVLWLLSAASAVGAVAGYLGPFSRTMDLIGGSRLQFFFLSWLILVPTIIGFVWRKSRCSLLVLTVIAGGAAINSFEVLPWYFSQGGKGTASGSGPEVKLLAFNVLHQNTHFHEVRQYLNKEKPDLAVFFEATGAWPRELLSLDQSMPHHLSFRKQQFEIFSRHPILEIRERLFGDHRGYVVIVLDVDGKRFTVCPNHAMPQFHYGESGFQLRNEQLEIGIGTEIAELESPVAVIGDLNVDIWSPLYRSMVKKSGLVDARRGFGVMPTHWGIGTLRHQHLLGRPIDHCLVTADVEVLEMKTGPPLGSDHLAVVVRLKLP